MNRSPIYQQVTLGRDKLLNPPPEGTFRPDIPVLLLPAAGRAIVSGGAPCCVEPVLGLPLIRHSIDAFRQAWPGAPVVCIVGQDSQRVADTVGGDVFYVQTANPDGGTGWATYEAFCLPELLESNPNIIISMGDRIVPRIIYEKLLSLHTDTSEQTQAVFSMTTVQYDPPMNRGRGRIVRDPSGRMMQILEEEEILREENRLVRNSLLSLTEGNCPIYVLRARTLIKYLMLLSNDNARRQYYLTDIVGEIARDGGDIRSIQIRSSQPEYAVLCTDVSGPDDIVRLEQALRLQQKENDEIVAAARQIRLARPTGQVDSICRQLRELYRATQTRKLGFRPDEPVAIGISGGRLRIALMHPDMGRFYGPALQTPLGAASEQGTEQIVLCLQESDDRRVHLFPLNPLYRESVDSIRADVDEMYPGDDVCDPYSYEEFGTRMSRRVLLGLGYFSEEELENRRQQGMPLPPRSLWVENNMRRPFSLVGNAIASLRTCRHGETGKTIQNVLGRDHFRGLRLASTGSLPQGGFSSSSALTVATKNAMNVLFNLGLTSDQLVQLACQAEYGTGVRAGALDQATEQKGAAGVGTLLSSNPR
ncbi:MAG: hypothetical protein PHQ75_05230, partial [Thermoguttaceae bacterium]|nr:hypothetical protein [Thermoguttaceae bacterium]